MTDLTPLRELADAFQRREEAILQEVAANGARIVRENQILRERLEAAEQLLVEARIYVCATNIAEHMLDGFGARSAQPSDELLARLHALLEQDQT